MLQKLEQLRGINAGSRAGQLVHQIRSRRHTLLNCVWKHETAVCMDAIGVTFADFKNNRICTEG